MSGDYEVKLVKLRLCVACLEGLGKECHTPGCALWIHNSPGHPIIRELYQVVPNDGVDEEARALLAAPDINRYCGYDYDAEACPMTSPCWHHRRNAYLGATPGQTKGPR